MTYRELVYMCLDEIKLASDDSYITEDHILFLISKYRAFLLRQKYEKTNTPVSESNYQCISVIPNEDIVPEVMSVAKPRVFTITEVEGDTTPNFLTYVSPHRYHFVGENRILKPITYCTIDHNKKLQCRNKELDDVNIFAVFEDIVKVSEFNLEDGADVLDCECPIETDLVSAVQELVVKDALGIAYRPKDIANNANDDLSSLGIASGNPKNNK